MIDFHIEKKSPIGTTFTVEMYGIWYNLVTRSSQDACDRREKS